MSLSHEGYVCEWDAYGILQTDSYKLQLELYEPSLGLLEPDLLSSEFL